MPFKFIKIFPRNIKPKTDYPLSILYHENSKLYDYHLDKENKKHIHINFTKYKISQINPTTHLEKTLLNRITHRDFLNSYLTFEELNKLLFFSYGKSAKTRTIPSAGALYPLNVYVFCNKVKGIQRGVYNYSPEKNLLESRCHITIDEIAKGCFYETSILNAAIVIFITGRFDRSKVKYGERGYRFTLMESGHLCQNLYLQCTSMQLGGMAIGGFQDDVINNLILLDGIEESTLYLFAVGRVSSYD